jgi:lipid A 3-O-deacylase
MGAVTRGVLALARVLLSGIAVVCLASPAMARDDETGTLSFVLENDVFYGLDRDYTNGLQIAWTTGPLDEKCWVCEPARVLPFFQGVGKIRINYALGQNMYTPGDITLANPPLTERPYAGWLYASLGIVASFDYDSKGQWSHLEQLDLSLGVVGPSSQAEQAQTLWHQLIGVNEPQGWDTQLKDEPALLLTYERSWRYRVEDLPFGLEMSLTPHLGGAVGNVFTYLNGGGTIMLGWNMGDVYGAPRIEPSSPGAGYFERPEGGIGLYAFAGVDARLVGYNIFLDGNTWKDSRSVDKEFLVGDAQVGVALTVENARLAFTHVFRTREFKTQHDADEFGAIALSWQF